MLVSTLALAQGPAQSLAARFPGVGGENEPRALLSFACAGDMKYGDSGSAPNRERFLREAGFDPATVLGLNLVHSRRVIFPSSGIAEGEADGLILHDSPLAATITVADCMPIWILDRGSGAYGILHSGWRGTGILAAAVESMGDRYGSRPESIAVILGPAIGSCCYAVSEERASAFAAEFGEACVSRRGDLSFIDLRAANLSMAEALGIGQLLSIEACTSCDSRLGSYRRQGPASFARMLALCGRPA